MLFEQCKRIQSLLSGFQYPWFIAGGWAIDLYLGRETREHSDIEIAIFRENQLHLKEFLTGWNLYKVDHHKISHWDGEFLRLPIHEIHACKKESGEVLEILLNEADCREWIYRRDTRIKLPKHAAWRNAESGLPILNPEIVLLYKSKNTREKDTLDFFNVKDSLYVNQKTWLRKAIELQHPNHEWLEYLSCHHCCRK